MQKRKRKSAERMPDKPAKKLTTNPDEAVLNLLSKSKADLSKERRISFYLYFPDRAKAVIAENELKKLGFEVECSQSYDEKNWLCLASNHLIPTYSVLTSLRKKLERIAQKLDGNYDGWETGLDADESEGLPNIKRS